MGWHERVEYALAHTRVLLYPRQSLFTFGTTNLTYYFLSELMDRADQVRLSKGQITVERPKIITPHYYRSVALEGFGEDASEFLQWLKSHEESLRFLEYGFRFKKELIYQQVLKEPIKGLADRMLAQLNEDGGDFASLIVGVDDFQEISLVQLTIDVIKASLPINAMEMEQRQLFDEEQGIPRGVREDIEKALRSAKEDPSKVDALGEMLRRYGLFERYQDWFFDVVRRNRP
jgi:hypothetical protein